MLQAIAQDPALRDLKLIAEPWDVGPGGHQLGAFPAPWGEWNDRYRDTVRRYWRGDAGLAGDLATRFAGSADVFAVRSRVPSRSVNFVTAHDGFTLADLVAYAAKHNESNGEDNRDGSDANLSWNHGVEGPTPDATVRARRGRDVRNLQALAPGAVAEDRPYDRAVSIQGGSARGQALKAFQPGGRIIRGQSHHQQVSMLDNRAALREAAPIGIIDAPFVRRGDE